MPTKTISTKKAEEYNQQFHKTVARIAKSRKSAFTVDDVVGKIGDPPQGRKALGALMNSSALENGLSIVDYVPSKVTSRRGALNAAWGQ